MEQREILVKSTRDGTMQPSLFYKTASNEARPLLVGGYLTAKMLKSLPINTLTKRLRKT